MRTNRCIIQVCTLFYCRPMPTGDNNILNIWTDDGRNGRSLLLIAKENFNKKKIGFVLIKNVLKELSVTEEVVKK